MRIGPGDGRSMRFGLTAFCTAESAGPDEVARAAEEAGFSLLLFPDHTHVPVVRRSPYPGGGDLPSYYSATHDPLIACAAAASATSRLRVGVGVCLVTARDPIVLAKQVASVDVLSEGRFSLGVGVGWNVEEVEDHGVAAADRWDVMRERVLAMKEIWTRDEASYHGRHVQFDAMWSWPKPKQRPHPPILVGGFGEGVLRRVVEYGDEWLAMVVPGLPPLAERIATLHRLAAAADRPPPAVSVQVYGDPPDDRVIEKVAAAGVDRVDLTLPHGDATSMLAAVERLAPVLRRHAGDGGSRS